MFTRWHDLIGLEWLGVKASLHANMHCLRWSKLTLSFCVGFVNLSPNDNKFITCIVRSPIWYMTSGVKWWTRWWECASKGAHLKVSSQIYNDINVLVLSLEFEIVVTILLADFIYHRKTFLWDCEQQKGGQVLFYFSNFISKSIEGEQSMVGHRPTTGTFVSILNISKNIFNFKAYWVVVVTKVVIWNWVAVYEVCLSWLWQMTRTGQWAGPGGPGCRGPV